MQKRSITRPIPIIPEYKVIFIRPQKVAGSSLYDALMSSIGISDSEEDSKNYKEKVLKKCLNSPFHYDDLKDRELAHFTASQIKEIIQNKYWDNYLKISIVRCPYDTMISQYYWRLHKYPGEHYKQFTLQTYSTINALIYNYSMLCINDRSVVDFYIRYENLHEDIKKLADKINCPGLLDVFQNTKIHTIYRPFHQDIYTVYAKYPLTRAIIDEYFSNNMENELIKKYYPLYKKQIDLKLGESKYFHKAIARVLYKNRKMLSRMHKLLGSPLYYLIYINLFWYKVKGVKSKIQI